MNLQGFVILSHVTLPFVVSHSGVLKSMNDFPLRFEVRPLLTSGGMGNGPGRIFILVADDLTRAEAEITVWHEIVHVMKMAAGHVAHDEQEIDRIATKLAQVCPEVIELCGLEQQFPKVVAASGIEPPRLTLSESGPSAVPG